MTLAIASRVVAARMTSRDGRRVMAIHRDRAIAPSRSLMLSAAIGGDHRRRDQHLTVHSQRK